MNVTMDTESMQTIPGKVFSWNNLFEIGKEESNFQYLYSRFTKMWVISH